MTPPDPRETRDGAERQKDLMARLPRQIAHAQAHADAFAEALRGIDPERIDSRSRLATLPVIRKSELLKRQLAGRDHDVFGGFSTIGFGASFEPARRAGRVFASPGTIYEPEGHAPDYWRMAPALRAAGFRAGDLVHNSFSYHFTPAGLMMDGAARALGCTVFPAGVGQTEQQVRAAAELKPACYVGTPSFLKLMLEKAEEIGVAVPSIRHASVGGEAFPPALRDWFAARGVAAYQSYGTADLGLVAYETESREGLVIAEDVIIEIVRPGTGDVVPDGEVGEVVVTTLNPDYPLIRFGTGDLSAVLPGSCPSGRTNVRIKGWLGRADQTTKVRGMFVHPEQVAEIVRRHPEILKARLVVSGELADDRMLLAIEVTSPNAGLDDRVATSIRDVTKLRGEVRIVEAGSLPNDGKIIEDARRYD